jgi:hypothetical protein
MVKADFYDPRGTKRGMSASATDSVSASSVVSLLLTFAHGAANPAKFIDHCEISEVLFAMAALPMTPLEIARDYTILMSVPGMRTLLRYVNVSRVENEILEVAELNRKTTDSRRSTMLYLLCRYLTLTRLSHTAAIDTAIDWLDSGAKHEEGDFGSSSQLQD